MVIFANDETKGRKTAFTFPVLTQMAGLSIVFVVPLPQ